MKGLKDQGGWGWGSGKMWQFIKTTDSGSDQRSRDMFNDLHQCIR